MYTSVMLKVTNEENIVAWSNIPLKEIEAFGDRGDFARQHLLNPAIFSLLGEVTGKKVLDAGSGTGYLARLLAKMGAKVTAVEPATDLFKYALAKEQANPQEIVYLQEDLSKISYRSKFDIVVSNMVFMDIPDWQTAIINCIHALKPKGILVFSIIHPAFEERSDKIFEEKGYLKISEYLAEYKIQQRHGFAFHRPLSAYLNFVTSNSCNISQVLEPQLDEKLGKQQRNYHVPNFIVFKVVKK